MKKNMVIVTIYYLALSIFIGFLIGAPIIFSLILTLMLSYFTYVIVQSMNEAYVMDLAMGENNTHINVKMRAGVYIFFLIMYLVMF